MSQSTLTPVATKVVMTRDQVIARWQDIARTAAGDMPMMPDCAQSLFDFLYGGAANLELTNQLDDLDVLRDSEENVWKFVRAMRSDAEANGALGLTQPTFDSAKGSLCPLWPFCN